MKKEILKLLCRSFDTELTPKEKRRLDEALKKSAELRREKEQIAEQRKAISQGATLSFQPFFAERVINRITSDERAENGLEAFYRTLRAAFQHFAIVGAIVTLILITFNLGIGDSLSSEEVFFASDATYEELRELPLF